MRRRRATRLAVLAVAAILTTLRIAEASPKESKRAAGYVARPGPGGIRCAQCAFFRPLPGGKWHNHCDLVAGWIDSQGHCDFFARR